MMNQKHILSILACLMLLVSTFAASGIVTVQAPVPEPIIMWAVITTDPYWGYYGGYHDMVYAIKDELIKIGIDMRIKMFEPGVWWDIVWEDKWNVPGDADGHPETYTYGVDGWDFFVGEWWLNPTSYIWMDELAYSWLIYPTGWNIMPWLDDEADYLYHQASTTLDKTEHLQYMYLWQERFMHNPPIIPIYYSDIRTAEGSYLKGYDQTSWWYELTKLRIDKTKFDAVAPAARKNVGSDTVIWGAAEPIWAWNPLMTLYYTEEMMNVMAKGLLYRNSRENMETEPPSGKYTVIPQVAADFPTWHTCSELGYTYEEDYPVARVPIREGIYWSDGVPFNATDVAFSFKAVINPEAGGYAYGDYVHLIKDVVAYNATTADFILYETDYDFAGYDAHGWGLGWIPYHQMKDVPFRHWKTDATNFNPIPKSMGGQGLECIGPYVPVNWVSDVMVELVRYDVYMREYRKPPLPTYSWSDYYWADLGWGAELPKKAIVKIIPDAADRLIALQKLEVDFCEYPTAPLDTWNGMIGWPTHNVLDYNYPASNPLWFNLDNEILSNRYVRLAIAHAIPYQKIFDILPGWGVAKVYPGKTWVTPFHESFHPTLPPYEYDIAKAKMYMNMWRYSQAGMEYTLGPVGDADFSGWVRTADFPIWVDHLGESYPWITLPGNDIDPDHNNNGKAELDDFFKWRDNLGKQYPFPGAR